MKTPIITNDFTEEDLANYREMMSEWPTGPCVNCWHQPHGGKCGTQIMVKGVYTTCSCTDYLEDVTKK